MAQRTSQGVMDGGSALPSGTAQPALPLAEALGRRNPDQRAPSPALAKKEALYATRPKPPAQLIRATRSFRGSMAGLYAPLPTLRRRPRGRLRTDRGRRGLLLLHRSGLSPHTPCQSPGALTCIADIPLPSNVHRYYSPGATHGGGTGSFAWAAPGTVAIPAGESLLNNPIPETFTNNALTYAFIQLLMSGTPMPPSVYPTLARRELVPNTAAAEGFPNIPGLPYQGDQAWPPFVYDFGPGENYDQESGVPTIQPPIIKSVLPVYATKVNEDGNEDVTGLPTVLGEAPLGTYVGWNLATTGWYGPNASNGPGSVGQVFAGAGNSGGYWPFWDTQAHRAAAGDPRLSLQERYGTHAGYVCVVTAAANWAVQQRFLLASDAHTLISNATASNVLGPPYAPTPADITLANSLCSH